MWRKTRKPQQNSCIGVDANRNFDFHHAGESTVPKKDLLLIIVECF